MKVTTTMWRETKLEQQKCIHDHACLRVRLLLVRSVCEQFVRARLICDRTWESAKAVLDQWVCECVAQTELQGQKELKLVVRRLRIGLQL